MLGSRWERLDGSRPLMQDAGYVADLDPLISIRSSAMNAHYSSFMMERISIPKTASTTAAQNAGTQP